MKTIIKPILKQPDRDLYWTRVVFTSRGKTKKTQVFACASREYLEDCFKITNSHLLDEKHLNKWVDNVIKKWSSLKSRLFKQDVHYDIYANTPEGEANGLDFLLKKVKSS